jgi:hypothetical protein
MRRRSTVGKLSREEHISRLEKTAEYHQKTGDREWAYAKNGQGGEHFAKAKSHYAKAEDLKSRAKEL